MSPKIKSWGDENMRLALTIGAIVIMVAQAFSAGYGAYIKHEALYTAQAEVSSTLYFSTKEYAQSQLQIQSDMASANLRIAMALERSNSVIETYNGCLKENTETLNTLIREVIKGNKK